VSDPKQKTDEAFERLFAEASSAYAPPAVLKDTIRRRMKPAPWWQAKPALWMGTAAAVLMTVVATVWQPWSAPPPELIQVVVTDGAAIEKEVAKPVGAGRNTSGQHAGETVSEPAPPGDVAPAPSPPSPEKAETVTGGVMSFGPSMNPASPAPPPPGPAAHASVVEGSQDFSEGLAARRGADGKIGFIDVKGKWVIQPQFDYNHTVFRDGLALVHVGRSGEFNVFFIDRAGKPVPIPSVDEKGKPFRFASAFHDGLAVICQDGNYGFANRQGKVVIPPTLSHVQPFSGGLAMAEAKTPGGEPWEVYIDLGGKTVLDLKKLNLGSISGENSDFHEGVAVVSGRNGKWGFIGPDGRLVIEARFDQAKRFSEGLAAVQVGSKWGYIDHTGKTVIKPQFLSAYPFHEGLARVEIPKVSGMTEANMVFINATGIPVITNSDCGSGISSFSGGLCGAAREVQGQIHDGYIDHKGNFVIDLGP
jgi:hypothetical protein